MGISKLLGKRKKPDANSSLFDGVLDNSDGFSDAMPNKPRGNKADSFYNLPQSGFIANDPGMNDYAERWGAASVATSRAFILAFIGMTAGITGAIFALKASTEQKAQPILVEFNGNTGEYKKPVRIDSITATDAMVKYTLGKWSEWVFTVDPKMSYGYLQDADVIAKGRARGQFSEYRYKTEIIRHIKEAKRIVFATTKSVDILQLGVAIVSLETQELDPNGGTLERLHYRIRLDYTVNPPRDADLVLRNPIGLEVDGFTYERLVK